MTTLKIPNYKEQIMAESREIFFTQYRHKTTGTIVVVTGSDYMTVFFLKHDHTEHSCMSYVRFLEMYERIKE